MIFTCEVGAGFCVKGVFSQDDLMGDDGEAVDVSFLGDARYAEVLRGCPLV